ncbi:MULTISPECIES: hypothetical protein [Clostridia]|uniref:hypothetical protein n=1 Tax=Clostridia TaxID=186801 RepID=UPI0012E23057|nr:MULTISPECIES: hypothetical protein [Clostridia]
MKDFNDFISQITQDDYKAMCDDIINNREPCSVTYAIPEISFKMSLKLLEKYHAWLNE